MRPEKNCLLKAFKVNSVFVEILFVFKKFGCVFQIIKFMSGKAIDKQFNKLRVFPRRSVVYLYTSLT